MSEYELYHYGVVGMKWGIRRGKTAKAYTKASKKLDKIDTKIKKQTEKFHKKAQKAETAGYLKREKAQRKANKAARRLTKTTIKGKKWVKAMEKNFKNTDVTMTKEQIDLGRKYSDFLTSRFNMRY